MQHIFYTDGSCYPNPGPGGWAFIKVDGDNIVDQQSGKEENTTNNHMEFMAIYKVIEYCIANKIFKDVIIYSDSQYCINTLDLWLYKWIQKGRTGYPNESIIKVIHELRDIVDLEFVWIKGHADNKHNNIVDKLASYSS